jgi:2,3-dihydroxyphenylpropionate 1,2-dioxygenase
MTPANIAGATKKNSAEPKIAVIFDMRRPNVKQGWWWVTTALVPRRPPRLHRILSVAVPVLSSTCRSGLTGRAEAGKPACDDAEREDERMPAAALCASHTPLMRDGEADAATRDAVVASFARLAAFVRDFAPDLVVQFYPDHFNGFFYDMMPSFCVGTAAESVGDWGIPKGPLDVPADEALSLAAALRDAGFDPALSYRMMLDHGFTQIWDVLFGRLDPYPIIPIFVNCAAPPLPTMRRVRLLGEAVGRHVVQSGRRVLFAASGGLSHDPPIPDIATAAPERREFLIAGRNPTEQARAAREARVREAGRASARGEGPCQPLDPVWDRMVIDLLSSGDLARADAWTDESIRRGGGRGGHEIRAWLAALAALSAAGPYRAALDFYEAIPAWIAGMAMLTAETTTARAA